MYLIFHLYFKPLFPPCEGMHFWAASEAPAVCQSHQVAEPCNAKDAFTHPTSTIKEGPAPKQAV